MTEDEIRRHSNPNSFLVGGFEVFECEAIPVPPGTPAPPRPPGRDRTVWNPVTEPFEVFDCEAIPMPPGTPAPPRPPGRERVRLLNFTVGILETQPATAEAVTELLRLVQGVVDGPPDPAKLDALRQAAALIARAG